MASYLPRTRCHKGQCGKLAANLRAACWIPGMARVPVVPTKAALETPSTTDPLSVSFLEVLRPVP